MAQTIDQVKAATNRLVQSAVKLLDPQNVDSQIQRNEIAGPRRPKATPEERKLIQLGEERYEEARLGRERHHERFYNGIRFYVGLHGGWWDGNSGQVIPFSENPDFKEKFTPKKENMVRVIADRTVARLTGQFPDAWAAPLTDSAADRECARIHRAINAHCNRANNREELLHDALLACTISTTAFVECAWDKNRYADVGIPQPDGSIKYLRKQIGDVANNLMLAIDAYPDPNAALRNQGINGGAYFIKRGIYSVDFVNEKWGVWVDATGNTDTYGSLEQRLEWIAGDNSRQMSKVKNATEVTEVWEKPSTRYPTGRFWVYSADKTMLYSGEWPYEWNDRLGYPFVDFSFAKNFGSIWALNQSHDLIDDQLSLNNIATYLSGRTTWDRPVRFNPDNSAVMVDQLKDTPYGAVIGYRAERYGGQAPKWDFPPPPGDFYFNEERRLRASMEMTAGVHDFNSDQANQPNSGFELELRMQEDKSRLGPVYRRACRSMAQIYEWDAHLYRQNGGQWSRLLGLDDRGNPGSA